MRKIDTQVETRKIVDQILKRYPIIESMKASETDPKAIIKLQLGGFKRGKTTTYSYPLYQKSIKFAILPTEHNGGSK